jgi:hypothetical protein
MAMLRAALNENSRDPAPALHSANRWISAHADRLAMLAVGSGLLLRLHAAWGIFLNPDEALHFSLANQNSFADAYRASLTLAHPPLLILLLYFWRSLGTSDVLLRLPSILAATAFCWMFYRWATEIIGAAPALLGTVMVACLPPVVSLTSEVRQYSLLLVFIASSAFLMERSLAKNSAGVMICSLACQGLGMLSHYSSLPFAATLGLYSLLRLWKGNPTRSLWMAWAAGQAGCLMLFGWLYHVQLSRLKDSPLAEQAIMEWLRRSYFHPGQDNFLAFTFGRSFAVFQFVFGQLVFGDIAALLFVAGVILLIRAPDPAANNKSPSCRQVAALLVLPFAINCGLALAGKYPYGGTRHCIFLALFAVAGISFAIFALSRRRNLVALIATLIIVAVCYGLGFHHQPYMSRRNQGHAQIESAVAFIKNQIPANAPILIDYQTNLMLRHYLCGQLPGGPATREFQETRCAGHILVAAPVWMFTPEAFPSYWRQFASEKTPGAGSPVWVVQAGWGASIAPQLARMPQAPAAGKSVRFGENISAIELTR